MFTNKAQNLNYLESINLKNFIVPKFVFFNYKEWKKNNNKLINKAKKKLNKRICIRSSYFEEDSSKHSLAGKFDSFIDVKNNKKNINLYIENLIRQYKKSIKNIYQLKNSYFIIQNYVKNSICSGVITNYSLDGAPYYTINYNDISSSTLSVTSGDKDSSRVLYVSRNSNEKIRSKKFRNLIQAIKNIEKEYNYLPLDIEFAVEKNFNVNILQIRPIATQSKWKKINANKFLSILKKCGIKFNKIKKRNIAYGNKPIFGLMPDLESC